MEQSDRGSPPQDNEAGRPAGEMDRRTILVLVLATVVVLAILLLGGYALVANPGITARLRDISIIVLAFVSVVIGMFLVVLIFQIQSLIALLREEIGPILESANQTANTLRGTTAFVGDAVVTPIINAASYASGVGHTIRLLTGTNRRRSQGPQPSQRVPDATKPAEPIVRTE